MSAPPTPFSKSTSTDLGFAELLPVIVWTAKADGIPDDYNHCWYDYTGITPEQAKTQTWEKVIHPEDYQGLANRWFASIKSGNDFQIECRIRRAKDGQYRWHLTRATAVKDSSGNVLRWHGVNTDIQDYKVMASEVQLEQQKFETIFNQTSSSLAVLQGPKFIYEKVNESYHNLFLNRPLVGLALLDAIPELRGQSFPGYIAHVFATGEAYQEIEAEAFLRKTENSPLEKRHFDQSYTRMLDAQGEPYGVLIQAIDVTERVEARRVLAESDERFRNAVNAAKMGTWAYNLEDGTIDLSPRSMELFGIKPVPEMKLENAVNRIHAEDQERVNSAIGRAVDPSGSGDYNIEYRIVHDDGSIRWVSAIGKAFFGDGPQGQIRTRFAGTVLDVTEKINHQEILRKSERQFKMIAELLPQMVWTATPDGVLDYTNQRWTQYSGSDEPALWHTFVDPRDAERVFETWTASVQTGKYYESEFRLLRHSDQTYRWFLVRADSVLNADGRVERWVGACTDVEDQKRAETELKQALAIRSEFLSVASHELKTPLTSLKLQTQSMRRNFQRGKPEAYSVDRVNALIDNNERQISRLVRLVDDMLDFSKIEAGKMGIHREITDVTELTRGVYEQFKEQLDATGMPSRFFGDTSIVTLVDPFRIEQVITNLFTNALRYGKQKPIQVKVMQKNKSVIISVQDQGIGISPENRARIFNRFERAVSHNDVSGLGLGLYITQQIVDGHHGRVWVESEFGTGSTFYVELPIVEE
jgi:PAS domain S-box-containing protein